MERPADDVTFSCLPFGICRINGNLKLSDDLLDIIESVDSVSKDERGFPLTQYIANGRISRGGYTFTHFKHHHFLRLISYGMSV